jgi:hypothetical protein
MPDTMPRTIEVEQVERLDIRPGEVLLVTVPDHTSAEVAERIRERFERRLPDVKILIKTAGITVKVISEVGEDD